MATDKEEKTTSSKISIGAYLCTSNIIALMISNFIGWDEDYNEKKITKNQTE